MATVTLSSEQAAGFDMWLRDTSAIIAAVASFSTNQSPTEVIYDNGLYRLVLTGTFPSFNIVGNPTQGTVTSFTLRYSSGGVTNSIAVTGLSLDVPTVFNLIDAGDEAGLNALVFGGVDTVTGSVAHETLQGHGGDDTLDGGDGNDVIYGDVHPSYTPVPAAGNDTLNGGNGADTLDGGGGDDIMNGGAGGDTIIAASGVDVIDGGADLDHLTLDRSSAGSPISFNLSTFQATGVFYDGTSVQNVELVTFRTGAGEDTLIINAGFNGEVIYDGGAGAGDHIVIDASAGSARLNINLDRITNGDTNLLRISNIGRITATGGSGNDLFTGRTGNDVFSGGLGADSLNGNDGDDTLNGGDGADSLNGGAGADNIDGGLANDSIQGGDGVDTILGGDGVDTINGNAGADTIDAGLGNDAVHYNAEGADQIDGGAGTDTMHFNLSSLTTGVTLSVTATNTPEGLVLSTGAVLRNFERFGNVTLGSGNDTVSVVSNNFGGGGATIAAGAGHDRFIGNYINQTQNLTLDRSGDGFLLSGIVQLTGFDEFSITGGVGDDRLTGGDGNDTLDGGINIDSLTGGLGHDIINGGGGPDTIHYALGDGADSIDGGDHTDTLRIDGMFGRDSILRATYDGALLTHVLDADVVNVELVYADMWDGVDWLVYTATAAVTVDLGTGDASGFANISEVENVIGGTGGDALTGNLFNNRLDGGLGADVLNGAAGADILIGGDGADTLAGGLGADSLNGGAGGDVLQWAWGDGADTLNGGADADTVNATGSGVDNLLRATWNGAVITNLFDNVLLSIEAINANMGAGVDWLIYTASAGATVDLNAGTASGFASITGVENVIGGSGADTFLGDGLNNRLDGGLGNDALSGGAGADILLGGDGADTLAGGLGNDSVQGGAGVDTLSWNWGDGRDTLNGGADADTLNATGSALENIVRATWNGSAITGLFDNALVGVETIHLDMSSGADWLIYNASTGVSVNLGAGAASGFASITSVENAIGGTGADTLIGDAASNKLHGGDGADVITGGAGGDILTGGLGADVFVYAAGAGNDSITDFDAAAASGQDFIDITAFGITSGDFGARVAISDMGANTVVTIDGSVAFTLTGVTGDGANVITQDDFLLA